MEKHVELGYLLDCYGPLLTERQRSLLSQSVEEDCSLAEIAEREGISRQGVRDVLQRAGEQLTQYEALLGLHARRARAQRAFEALRAGVECAKISPQEKAELLISANALSEELDRGI